MKQTLITFGITAAISLYQTAFAQSITICEGKYSDGSELRCKFDYKGETNIRSLYQNGWKLIAVIPQDSNYSWFSFFFEK